jgi:hypothetical protein
VSEWVIMYKRFNVIHSSLLSRVSLRHSLLPTKE